MDKFHLTRAKTVCKIDKNKKEVKKMNIVVRDINSLRDWASDCECSESRMRVVTAMIFAGIVFMGIIV